MIHCILLFVIVFSMFTPHAGVDVKVQKEKYRPNYSYYHNLTQIAAEVSDLVQNYGDFIISNKDDKSRHGRFQLLIRVSNFTMEKERPNQIKLLFAFGEHAREFFPVESMLYFIKNITRGLDEDFAGSFSHAYSAWVLNNFEIFIIGMANPDGRDQVEKTGNYCWRGTANGVDINRNFDWNFGGEGSSKYPDDGEYRGPQAFSEPETKIYRRITSSFAFDGFVSFHSGIRHIYVPFADSQSKKLHSIPKNIDDMMKLAKQMSKSSPLRPFKYGLAYRLNEYTADGTSFDFMAGTAKIPFSFALEMWEHNHHIGRSCFDEFNPKSEQLQYEVTLVHPLYVTLLLYIYKWKHEHGHSSNVNRTIIKPPQLLRVKKDEDHQRLPMRNNVLFVSETSQDASTAASTGSFESQVVYFFSIVVIGVCLVLGMRHICNMMKKKRIISLRSLSSTFTLLKKI